MCRALFHKERRLLHGTSRAMHLSVTTWRRKTVPLTSGGIPKVEEVPMQDWNNLEPDEYKLLSKHYTAGRSGKSITGIVLHHNAGNLSIEQCWNTWQTREASAHYQVDVNGRIGQLVHDRDTAWHAGNWDTNLTTIGIEHADVSNNPWKLSDATMDNGAHLVAAICKCYGLGRPEWNKNVFPHSKFSATACPASLAGDQNAAYMAKAQEYYDAMTGTTSVPSTQAPAPAQPTVEQLAVDGWCGTATIKRWQQVMGTTVDGVISGQLVPDQQTYWRPNLVDSCVTYGGNGSELIRKVQEVLGLEQDGLLGPATIKAVQARLCVNQDASFGPATVKALQNSLNAGKF